MTTCSPHPALAPTSARWPPFDLGTTVTQVALTSHCQLLMAPLGLQRVRSAPLSPVHLGKTVFRKRLDAAVAHGVAQRSPELTVVAASLRTLTQQGVTLSPTSPRDLAFWSHCSQ